MRHLSLFTGVGGGDLAHQHLLGWQTVGYVEFDKFCQQVLAQRIKDGFLHKAPIFGDIDGFLKSGAAKKYQGYVDVVTAGFPCQPFSVAGKQAGEEDPRNKWPQTIQCIRDIRPRYALLENVPGLLNSGYFPEILGSLAEAGFDARWIVLGADDVGAPHRRKRLWILADSNAGRIQSDKTLRAGGIASDDGSQHVADSRHAEPSGRVQAAEGQQSGAGWETWSEPASRSMDVADSDSDDGRPRSGTVAQGRGSRLEHRRGSAGQSVGRPGEDVADSNNTGQRSSARRGQSSREQARDDARRRGSEVADSDSAGLSQRRGAESVETQHTTAECSSEGQPSSYWPTEPQLGRVAHGLAHRVDRLKAIGNGQVSRVAATAWRILNDPNS